MFIVIDTNGTYIIALKANSDIYEVYDLHGLLEYTISYISVKDEISIVGEGHNDVILLRINENKIEFIWK